MIVIIMNETTNLCISNNSNFMQLIQSAVANTQVCYIIFIFNSKMDGLL